MQYGYDRASNRIWRKNTVAPSGGNDELYAYDGLQRLVDMARGTLAADKQSVGTVPTLAQSWNLDATGNWSGFTQTKPAGFQLDQQRTSNRANEITSISRRYGLDWIDPVYDKAGNMKTMPGPHAVRGLDLPRMAVARAREIRHALPPAAGPLWGRPADLGRNERVDVAFFAGVLVNVFAVVPGVGQQRCDRLTTQRVV